VNAKQRRERNTDLYRYRLRGFSLRTLASTYAMSERQCRRIIEAERARQSGMFDQTAQEYLEEHFDSLDAAAEDFALEAAHASSTTAKVNAIKAKVWVLKAKWRAQNEAGLLPRYKPRTIESGASLAVAIAEVLNKHDVSKAVIGECTDVITAWTEDRLMR
jgi:hypothetical protein